MQSVVNDRPAPQFTMTCASCVYLSARFRCQRVASRSYSMKIEEPSHYGCPKWEAISTRVRDG